MNAQSLPFVDDSFDVVVANHMLYHVPDPSLAVAELRRVLRDDGVLVASTNGPSHLRELDEISQEVFGPRSVPRYMEAFGTHSGEPILARHFGNVEWRGYDGDLVCTNADDVLAYLVSFPPGERATSRAPTTPRRARRPVRGERRQAARHEGDGRVPVPVGVIVSPRAGRRGRRTRGSARSFRRAH